MPSDGGKRLRSLYSASGGVGEVFASKVDDYAAARPSYPPQLFEFLRSVVGVNQGARVADVGAGTGLFTTGLLHLGYEVLAVEPSEGMRRAADARLGGVPGYSSAHGCAEAMPLPDGSVDLVTAAQAFHWFDTERARAEFLRVLKPGGRVALVWNDRVLADPLHGALDEVFTAFGGRKRQALVTHEADRDLRGFFGSCLPAELHWPHAQFLTEDGLQDLAFSRSYMPGRDTAPGRRAAQALVQVFQRFAEGGTVAVRYTARAFVGRPRADGGAR